MRSRISSMGLHIPNRDNHEARQNQQNHQMAQVRASLWRDWGLTWSVQAAREMEEEEWRQHQHQHLRTRRELQVRLPQQL